MPARVLIVEDEFLIALEMEEVVRDLGHIPIGVADNLSSALAEARDAATVDIALVDVNLADGATGPEIGRRLAAEFGVQVIFVTANTAQLGEGVSGTIGAVEKPVGVGELRQLIDFVERRRNGLTPPPPPVLRLFGDSHAA
ncbi:response regulator [Erythrobacter sp. SDW2]|uniref:response regulator n=1 Tax=Erythrobacter sp. SDW2 TaxID=2907154 RepID=UPI001F0C06CB|nr:response regulator [Erythrobacter sp. SDW2]UIP07632.1 response regulator [Erythrobacter sp. SDW2]